MRIDRSKVLTFTLGTALLTGCGSYEPAAPSPPPKTEQPQAAGQEEKPAPPKDEGRPGKKERTKGGTPGGNRGQPKSKPNAGEAKQPQADAGGGKTEQRKAEFGVGAKGHDYGPGVITTPLSVYFTIQERMVFEIKLPKAMESSRPPRTGCRSRRKSSCRRSSRIMTSNCRHCERATDTSTTPRRENSWSQRTASGK